MKFTILLAAAITLSSPLAYRTADAQQIDSAAIVRFRVRGESRLRFGDLSRLSADSLILDSCDRCSPLRYSRDQIIGLEAYRGETYVCNALRGFLAGGVIGGGVAALIVNSQTCSGDLCGLRYEAVPAAAFGGAFVGFLMGIALGKETWEPVQ